jgi:hypothetical protein
MATKKTTEEVVEQTAPVEQTQEPQSSNVGAAQVTATPTQTPATQTPTAEQNQQATQESTQQTTQQTTTQTTAPQTSYTQKITIKSPEVDPLEHLDTSTMEGQLKQMYDTAVQQQQSSIDYGTQQGVTELERAKEDAREQFQTQRNQVDIDEAKALDNQALYAEARGDKGGIGQAQYNQIQNAAATNRMTVNKAQTKLATDTARQIADLRAQGEFQKADAVLTLTQNYLSQLFQLGQWAAEYNLSIDQFNASLRQWSAEYEMGMAELGMAQDQWDWQVGQAEQENLANAGWAILEAGIMPSESQLKAMGLAPQQAIDFLNTRKVSGGRSTIILEEEEGDGGDTGNPTDDVEEDPMYVLNTTTSDLVNAKKGVNPLTGEKMDAWTRSDAQDYVNAWVADGLMAQSAANALVDRIYGND